MSERTNFTSLQSEQLRQAMKNGGIFLKLPIDSKNNVEVIASDKNGGWKSITTFQREMTSKILALYNNQKVYKAPIEAGYRKVSLSWFIAEYC